MTSKNSMFKESHLGCSDQATKRSSALATALLAIAFAVAADSWGPAAKEHWSRNRQYVLQVDVKRRGSELSLWHQTDSVTEHIWDRGYAQGFAPPYTAYVADTGRYVVLRDRHANLGYGKVIVILGPDGKLVAGYELKDFLPQEEIAIARGSLSSIYWAENAWLGFIHNDTRFALVSEEGTIRCFDLANGQLTMTDELRDQIRRLAVSDANLWATSEEAWDRMRGIILLGGLGETAAIPLAKRLLKDQTETGLAGSRQDKPVAPISQVQTAGARALLRLMGTEALPLLEAEILSANWWMQQEFLKTLTQHEKVASQETRAAFSQALQELWLRSLTSPATELRDHAVVQRLSLEDGRAYLYAHPDLIENGSEKIRSQALQLLLADPTPQAEPLLRRALSDSNSWNQLFALSALVNRQATNLEPVLLRFLDQEDTSLHAEALRGLAQLRHPKGMAVLKDHIRAWQDHVHETGDKTGQVRPGDPFHLEARLLCRSIAEMHLLEVKPLLEEVWLDTCPDLIGVVSGALAVLGHEPARARLHAYFAEGNHPDSIHCFIFLALLGDEESIRLLTEASQSKDGMESRSARAALERYPHHQRVIRPNEPPVPSGPTAVPPSVPE